MKKNILYSTIAAVALTTGSQALAVTKHYELKDIYPFDQTPRALPYPTGTDNALGVTKVSFSLSLPDDMPLQYLLQDTEELDIKNLKIRLLNGETIAVNTLTKVQNGYEPTYTGSNTSASWIYDKLHVNFVHGPFNPRISLYVDPKGIETPDVGYLPGSFKPVLGLFGFEGALKDVTPNTRIADNTAIKVDGKPMKLSAYQSLDLNPENGEVSIKLRINWLGHGERTVNIRLDHPAQGGTKIAAVKIIPTSGVPLDGPITRDSLFDYALEFTIDEGDPSAPFQTTWMMPQSLRELIDQHYPQSFTAYQ